MHGMLCFNGTITSYSNSQPNYISIAIIDNDPFNWQFKSELSDNGALYATTPTIFLLQLHPPQISFLPETTPSPPKPKKGKNIQSHHQIQKQQFGFSFVWLTIQYLQVHQIVANATQTASVGELYIYTSFNNQYKSTNSWIFMNISY